MRADTQVLHFESAAALGAFYAEKNPQRMKDHKRNEWTDESPADAVRFAAEGRDHLVGAAQGLLDQIENAGIELDWPRWQDSVAGSLPNVPAYLAGLPECMRAKVQARSERAPLRIFVDLTSSAGIEHTQLAKRGTAVLALAMLLSAQRPVELCAVVGLSGGNGGKAASVAVIRIPAAPLELASACYALTSSAFAREIGYRSLMAMGSGGGWEWNMDPTDPEFDKRMREALDMQPADLYLGPPHWDMRRDPIVADPVKWINGELSKLQATVDA